MSAKVDSTDKENPGFKPVGTATPYIWHAFTAQVLVSLSSLDNVPHKKNTENQLMCLQHYSSSEN
jgi:hypothetical protein